MKKSFLIFAMFSLMMLLTSFTTPNEIGGRSSTGELNIGGRSSTGELNIGGRSSTGEFTIGGRSSTGEQFHKKNIKKLPIFIGSFFFE